MSPVPIEFDPADIAAKSAPDLHMYRDELASKDPMTSVLEANPEIYFVPPQRRSDWGKWEFKPGSYYDTTIGSQHPFWREQDMPQPRMDVRRLRADLLTWGY